ncbi:LLM class flavin-dependent oxidoreductase [Nakamurella sp. YIM 132087]|uniref:LLM class flavin-dependent oxidoreductase n=1 Tax=Nakamurella alba TaxID=2665158 RepID=A0A7K1FUX9_9ACTN|nr:LLM class flavin-dependent oxidoreductase [Nakamurella alba]MTD16634.1 LLM class flavin-dependent oxidoreductase [Nakamurella alba]
MSTHIHLGLALDGAGWHPAAWREPTSRPAELFSAGYWTDLISTAERGTLDLVTIEDSLTLQYDRVDREDDRTDVVRGRLDALLIAARVAPVTRHIGLVPVVTTTHTEPFHVSKALATLDHTSRGRAGWQVRTGGFGREAAQFGRREIPALDLEALEPGELPAFLVDLFDEAGEAIDVVRRLWDSWEDDAEIRDVEHRRFIDREKVHHIDFVGSGFSVRGPSITPRSPQGQPVISLLAHRRVPYLLAAAHADLVFVTPTDDERARGILAEVGDAVVQARQSPEPLQVWADVVVFLDGPDESGADRLRRLDGRVPLETETLVFAGSAADLADRLQSWNTLGYHGFRLRPGVATDDVPRIADDLVPELRRRGQHRETYPDTNLRGLIGLPTSVPNRYATA